MTTPSSSWAGWRASADLPLAVGPAMTTAFSPCLSAADASPIVPPAMKSILTLIAAPTLSAPGALKPDLIETLATKLRASGAGVGESFWLAPGNRACDLPFDGLDPQHAYPVVRATLADLPIDFHAQPREGRRKKLLIADMDSTIVTTETLDELAGEAGLKDVIAEIT